MLTGQAITDEPNRAEAAFETRDFYLACFLRCTGYELLNLRDEGRRKVFVFRDRADTARRRDGLLRRGRPAFGRWRSPPPSRT